MSPSPLPCTVLLVEDNQIVAALLLRILRDEADFTVLGQAKSLAEVPAFFAQATPDVILMDHRLPDGDGLEAATELHQNYPDTKIFLMSAIRDPEISRQAASSGLAGYLCKTDPINTFATAIRTSFKSPS